MTKRPPSLTFIKRVAIDLLFPRWCLGCGREGDYLCLSCRDNFTAIVPPLCSRCGHPATSMTCHHCSGWKWDIDGVRAPFLFQGLWRQAILEYKYRNLRALAPTLASLLYDYLLRYPVPGDVLVPVPLHPRRWRERGYNQSALIARELGRLSGQQVVENKLVRLAYAPPQVMAADINQRLMNVAGAFGCLDKTFEGKRVILIDDVATSGATLGNCAAALKAAGAASVWGLVLALEP